MRLRVYNGRLPNKIMEWLSEENLSYTILRVFKILF